MNSYAETQRIAGIHASGRRLAVMTTGGGSAAIGRLLAVPGGSRTIVEASVPYAALAVDSALGQRPNRYCSAETALAMAFAALRRVLLLDPAAADPVGVACTASLTSDRPKRGSHRIFVAWHDRLGRSVWELQLAAGARNREEEENVAASLLIAAIAAACGPGDGESPDTQIATGQALLADQLLTHERVVVYPRQPHPWSEVVAGRAPAFCIGPEPAAGALLFPGAFAPLHQGHKKMAAVAAARTGRIAAFEICVRNVDKPALTDDAILRRLGQFAPDQSVWLTSLPTFSEKAGRFPGATFVVGVDTLLRISEPRYYSEYGLEPALDALIAHQCRFLVFGRLHEGRFQTLTDTSALLPAKLLRLCTAIGADEFRADISSKEMRGQKARGF